MQLAIDARMLQSGGIGTYLGNLIPHFQKNCEVQCISLTAPIYSFKEQLQLPLAIPRCKVFWSPHFNVPLLPIKARRRVVTFHDLYHLDHLDTFSWKQRVLVKMVLERAIATADWIITVSEFSKQRILQHFPEAKEKISVIYSGADHLAGLKPKPMRELPEKFFLFVGNSKPHKNLKLLLKVFAKINAQLVVVGKVPKIEQQRIHSLGEVSSEELSWLYDHAEALIFPSLYEGWGLPPLEAMSRGCPVIASTYASIPEACGNSACYFNPQRADELCDTLLALPAMREKLILEGKKRACELTWEKAAKLHLQVFENVC